MLWGVLSVSVLMIRALPFGAYNRAPDFWKIPFGPKHKSIEGPLTLLSPLARPSWLNDPELSLERLNC